MDVKLVFLVTFLAATVALPIQEKDIDEIMYKLAEMKNELRVVNDNPLPGGGLDKGKVSVRVHEDVPTEAEMSRLLYDYYSKPVGRFYAKRDFDEIDRYGFDSFTPRYSREDTMKRNFDEIDRVGFSGFSKRVSRRPRWDAAFDRYNNRRSLDVRDGF